MATVIAITLLPSILIFYYIYTHDEHPEPKSLILKVAAFGALSSIPVLIVVLPIKSLGLPAGNFTAAAYTAFILAAIPEEFFKLSAVYKTAYNNSTFDEPFDGIIYGVASSLGFATLENVLYVSSYGLSTAIHRAYSAIPLHAFAGVIMGYYLGKAHFTRSDMKRKLLLFNAFLLPVLFHGLYDLFIFYAVFAKNQQIMFVSYGVLLVEVAFGIRLMKDLERNNIGILAEYHNIDKEIIAPYLPKGVLSENILPQIIQSLKPDYALTPETSVPAFFSSEELRPSITPVFAPEPEVPIIKQKRRTRGFLGFVYVTLGILLVTAGTLAFLGFLAEPDKDLIVKTGFYPKLFLGIELFYATFIAVNGLLIFFKGINRNRTQVKYRTFLGKLLLFITFFTVTIGIGAIFELIKKTGNAKSIIEDPTGLIITAVGFGFWITGLMLKKRRTPKNF